MTKFKLILFTVLSMFIGKTFSMYQIPKGSEKSIMAYADAIDRFNTAVASHDAKTAAEILTAIKNAKAVAGDNIPLRKFLEKANFDLGLAEGIVASLETAKPTPKPTEPKPQPTKAEEKKAQEEKTEREKELERQIIELKALVERLQARGATTAVFKKEQIAELDPDLRGPATALFSDVMQDLEKLKADSKYKDIIPAINKLQTYTNDVLLSALAKKEDPKLIVQKISALRALAKQLFNFRNLDLLAQGTFVAGIKSGAFYTPFTDIGKAKEGKLTDEIMRTALQMKSVAETEAAKAAFNLIKTKQHDYYPDFISDVNKLIEYIRQVETQAQEGKLDKKAVAEKLAALGKALNVLVQVTNSLGDARQYGQTIPKWRDTRGSLFNEYLGVKEEETPAGGEVPEAPPTI